MRHVQSIAAVDVTNKEGTAHRVVARVCKALQRNVLGTREEDLIEPGRGRREVYSWTLDNTDTSHCSVSNKLS